MVSPEKNSRESSAAVAEPMHLMEVLESLDFLVFVRVSGGGFEVCGALPKWAVEAFGVDPTSGVLEAPYVGHFVEVSAIPLWDGSNSGRVRSGIWTEDNQSSGSDRYFEAIAILTETGRRMLVIRRLGEEFDELQLLTQRANESALEHRHLRGEVQKKDVLLKCIVHDLNNPLNAILLNLELLANNSDERIGGFATVALEAARRQSNLIKSIAEVFSSDLSRLGRNRHCSEPISALIEAAESVVKTHLSEAMRRNVSILLEDAVTDQVTGDRPVRAEAAPFLRVLENLVINALRHAPTDSTVTVRLGANSDGICVNVDDAGEGVESSLLATLFDPFTQGTTHRGSMGLGLYFCCMTIEQWNGRIYYEPIPAGGARFVFTLPWASTGERRDPEDEERPD